MNSAEKEAVLHCLKSMIDEEVCEECPLYGTTGTDHCEKDCVRLAINALEQEPCDDAISREAVLDLCDSKDAEYKVCHFKEDVECLPPVTPAEKVGRWIPVSERLPKDDERVLVTRRIFHWANEPAEYAVGIESFSGNVDFVAWMPLYSLLPEPYKAESEG